LWSYASVEEFIKVIIAVVVANIFGIIYLIYMGEHLFFGVYITSMLFELIIVGCIRFSYRLFRSLKNRKIFNNNKDDKKILIVGSGSTATLIATEIKNHSESYGKVVGFIDDDEKKLNKTIAGVKVLGNNYDIGSIVHKFGINEIIVATPTADPTTLRMILSESKRTTAKVRIIPGIREMIDGQVSLNKIRDVEIEDLLGRDTVNLNVREVIGYLEGKIVMVTGGGGSIGSELCRQIARFNPGKLIILDNYENWMSLLLQ
jgi:FlaA1/EpsC-like NDP-sugar epimerase